MSLHRVFRTKTFTRWMTAIGLTDAALTQVVREMSEGLIDADLGGSIYKKRVALPGRGKRGGARTIVATRLSGKWFFLYGFGKNDRSNIDKDELRFFQELAKDLFGFDEKQLQVAISTGQLKELGHDSTKT